MLEKHRVEGMFRIENESHTFGNLITHFLQNNDKILFAGYKIDHLLVKELIIGYKTNGTDIIEILNESINEAKILYEQIIKQVQQLSID
jgi:DNA-directed RNA polymerase subunit L